MSVLLADIPFTSPIADQVRNILRESGCVTDDDIVNLGCTGLMLKLVRAPVLTISGNALAMAVRVRENMGGSGCGLPCYVPPDRFCMVHNTIGGLERGQSQRNPDGVSYCSHEVTGAQAAHMQAVQAKITQEGLKEGAKLFGLEPVEDGGVLGAVDPIGPEGELQDRSSEFVGVGDKLASRDGRYYCMEHGNTRLAETDWVCQYCLAASIANGGSPQVQVVTPGHTPNSIATLQRCLRDDYPEVSVVVTVAKWTRKLVREE